jgi:alpha-amylase
MTTSTTGKYVANPGGGVMMQAFTGTCPLAARWNTTRYRK